MRGRVIRSPTGTSWTTKLQTDFASHLCKAPFIDQTNKESRLSRNSSTNDQQTSNAGQSDGDEESPKLGRINSRLAANFHRGNSSSSGARAASRSPTRAKSNNSTDSPRSTVYDGHGDLRESLNRSRSRNHHRSESRSNNSRPNNNSGGGGSNNAAANDLGPATSPISGDEKSSNESASTAPEKASAAASKKPEQTHQSSTSSSSSHPPNAPHSSSASSSHHSHSNSSRRHVHGLSVKIDHGHHRDHHHHHHHRDHHHANSNSSRRRASSSATEEAPSPKEIPLYPKRTSKDADESESGGNGGGGAAAGAGSRPGTPLYDEKPENNSAMSELALTIASLPRVSYMGRSEPMSLPLPSFARSVFKMKSSSSSSSSASTKDRDPRLKSPGASLKSPPALKSPAAPPAFPVLPRHAFPLPDPADGRPQDPRLAGLLQMAASGGASTPSTQQSNSRYTAMAAAVAQAAAAAVTSKHSPATTDVKKESLASPSTAKQPSSGDLKKEEKAELSLDERIRALNEKYDKWNDSTKQVDSATTT